MTISKWTAAGGLAIALLVGLLFGRYAAPSRVMERDHIVTTDREIESTWRAYVGRTKVENNVRTRWLTKTVWAKDGSVTQTRQAAEDRQTKQETTVDAREAKVREVVKYQEVVHEKIIEAKRPDWLIGARAGLGLDRQPVYGGEIDRRILGPVWIGAWGQYPTAGGVSVKLMF